MCRSIVLFVLLCSRCSIVFIHLDCIRDVQLEETILLVGQDLSSKEKTKERKKKKDRDDKDDERQVPKMFLVSTQCFFLFYNNPMCGAPIFEATFQSVVSQ